MKPWKLRGGLALGILLVGLGGELAMERALSAPRPLLNGRLAGLPMTLGNWVGQDVPMDPVILRETQCDDYINRIYRDRSRPGREISLWINYSQHGLNLRHSPAICLPSGGWTPIEAITRVAEINARQPGNAKDPKDAKDATAGGDNGVAPLQVSLLGYGKGDLTQTIGFWYYIFGEGWWEDYVRSLPITSRSSHGRTTRGSGMTVEVFCSRDHDPDQTAVTDFIGKLTPQLEPLLPKDHAHYYLP